MSEPISSAVDRLGSQRHRVVLVRELRALGWSQAAIRGVTAGLTRLFRGAYATHVPEDPAQRHLQLCAAVAAMNPGLCMSYLSAATLWQLPTLDPPPIHPEVVPIGSQPHGWRAPSGVRHRGQPIDPSRVQWVEGIPVTDVTRTVVDCARVVPHHEAVVIGDAALHRGQTKTRWMLGVIGSQTGWKGIDGARRMLARIDGRSESPGETLTRIMAQDLGFEVTSQVEVLAEGQFVARVDFLVDGEYVVIEFDGRSKYELDARPAAIFMAEKRRHDELVMCGYEVVRLTWPDLDDPHRVRTLLQAAVARARLRHPGTPNAALA